MYKLSTSFFLAVILVVVVPASAQTTLRFPLKDGITSCDGSCTPETAPISSVFDHSMKGSTDAYSLYNVKPRGVDSRIVAYTGETGEKRFKDTIASDKNATKAEKDAAKAAAGEQCYAQETRGQEFVVNGHYQGLVSLGPTFLSYDNHPGYDYAVPNRTKIYAAFSGKIHYPHSMVGIRYNGRAYKDFHALEIDSAPYKVYYLHLSTHPDSKLPSEVVEDTTGGSCPQFVTLPMAEGTDVQAGCLIGLSGDAGAPGAYHLHFEVQKMVPLSEIPASLTGLLACTGDSSQGTDDSLKACVPVDPYGGATDDPYVALTGIAAQRLWTTGGATGINFSSYGHMIGDAFVWDMVPVTIPSGNAYTESGTTNGGHNEALCSGLYQVYGGYPGTGFTLNRPPSLGLVGNYYFSMWSADSGDSCSGVQYGYIVFHWDGANWSLSGDLLYQFDSSQVMTNSTFPDATLTVTMVGLKTADVGTVQYYVQSDAGSVNWSCQDNDRGNPNPTTVGPYAYFGSHVSENNGNASAMHLRTIPNTDQTIHNFDSIRIVQGHTYTCVIFNSLANGNWDTQNAITSKGDGQNIYFRVAE